MGRAALGLEEGSKLDELGGKTDRKEEKTVNVKLNHIGGQNLKHT